MSDEIWKDIPGYEGLYQASSVGNIRSLNYHRQNIIKNMKPYVHKHGYLMVNLRKDNEGKGVLVHRLVALTFIPKSENKNYVDHIDSNKSNNTTTNLRWCTNQENVVWAYESGTMVGRKGIEHHNNKLTEENVREIKNLFNTTKLCNFEISQMYNVGKNAISKIRCGTRWSHITLEGNNE